jgi:uncharacterized protein (DUF1778 family)
MFWTGCRSNEVTALSWDINKPLLIRQISEYNKSSFQSKIMVQIARIEARIDPELKAKFQTAADIENITLCEFLVKSAREAADRTISNHNVLKLNAEDSRAFVEAILNPAEPNEVLKEAARRYKQEFGNVS